MITLPQDFNDVSTMYLECLNKYGEFSRLVQEFEQQDGSRCRGLKVEHFMLKPVQRLPQYKLLLENYLKNLAPDSGERAFSLSCMCKVVFLKKQIEKSFCI